MLQSGRKRLLVAIAADHQVLEIPDRASIRRKSDFSVQNGTRFKSKTYFEQESDLFQQYIEILGKASKSPIPCKTIRVVDAMSRHLLSHRNEGFLHLKKQMKMYFVITMLIYYIMYFILFFLHGLGLFVFFQWYVYNNKKKKSILCVRNLVPSWQ